MKKILIILTVLLSCAYANAEDAPSGDASSESVASFRTRHWYFEDTLFTVGETIIIYNRDKRIGEKKIVSNILPSGNFSVKGNENDYSINFNDIFYARNAQKYESVQSYTLKSDKKVTVGDSLLYKGRLVKILEITSRAMVLTDESNGIYQDLRYYFTSINESSGIYQDIRYYFTNRGF